MCVRSRNCKYFFPREIKLTDSLTSKGVSVVCLYSSLIMCPFQAPISTPSSVSAAGVNECKFNFVPSLPVSFLFSFAHVCLSLSLPGVLSVFANIIESFQRVGVFGGFGGR